MSFQSSAAGFCAAFGIGALGWAFITSNHIESMYQQPGEWETTRAADGHIGYRQTIITPSDPIVIEGYMRPEHGRIHCVVFEAENGPNSITATAEVATGGPRNGRSGYWRPAGRWCFVSEYARMTFTSKTVLPP